MQIGTRLGFLKSRIARRVFLTFVACALGPLALHVWMSTHEIEGQLAEQAAERLDLEAKTMTMSVAARVRSFAAELERVCDGVRERGPTLPAAGSSARRHLDEMFEGLDVLDANGDIVARIGVASTSPTWAESELRHLAGGHSLLTTRVLQSGAPRLLLARAVISDSDERLVVVARPNARQFWDAALFTPPDTHLSVLDANGHLLHATSHADAAHLDAVPEQMSALLSGRFEVGDGGDAHLGAFRTLFLKPTYLNNVTVVLTQSRSDVLSPARGFRRGAGLSMALAFLLVIWLSFRQVRRSLVPVETLVAATGSLANKQLETRVTIATHDEFEDLAGAFNRMAESLAHHARVERGLYDLGLALNAELDSKRLIAAILDGALRVANAQAACLYSARSDGELELSGFRLFDKTSSLLDTTSSELPAFSCRPSESRCAAALAVRDDATLVINDVEARNELEFDLELELARRHGLEVQALVSVPLREHDGHLLGVLQVMRAPAAASGFEVESVRLVESVAAQAAVALAKSKLIEDLRNLVTSISEVFALAIDEKSPYTGAHCRRVPDLTMMLVESAMRDQTGPLREFRPTDDELYEIRIAALMHDCGKIVTPVHIIDKATKLEAIHDRIELVELRSTIVARDAEVALLRRHLAALGVDLDSTEIAERKRAIVLELTEERDFLRRCNLGSESMPRADIERVQHIANQRAWLDLEGRARKLLTDNEVENLSVKFGTLRASERQIINDHIVVTLKMLEGLHYPRGLENVPLIAGAHHERMDGKGYPRQLKREQIPWAGRMLGVADVFEALTDPNRPYKKGKTLQESLEIMGRMATSGHLDPDIFQLFVEDEVYLRYARAFLPPERIDTVDLSRVPGYTARAKSEAA